LKKYTYHRLLLTLSKQLDNWLKNTSLAQRKTRQEVLKDLIRKEMCNVQADKQ
jgi:hypothetical protein